MTITPDLSAARTAQARLRRSENRTAHHRAERDALVVALAREGHSYRDLAEAFGLSLAAIGKITSAGGIRRYKLRNSGAPTTLTGEEDDHGKTAANENEAGEPGPGPGDTGRD